MADYRCPNCAGYSNHDTDCPTGGIAAKAVDELYRRLQKAVKDRKMRDIIDKAWQDDGLDRYNRWKDRHRVDECDCSYSNPHTDGKNRFGMHWYA